MTSTIKCLLGLVSVITLSVSCTSMAETPGTNINQHRSIKPIAKAEVDNRSTDRLGRLIEDSEQAYKSQSLTIEQHTRIRPSRESYASANFDRNNNRGNTNYEYTQWLNLSPYRASEAESYRRYLASYVGEQGVPPFDQLLTTARSWESCGYEQYQLPPYELWSNMVPTLKLYNELKRQGIIPPTAEIRSAYRSPSLNACAGGAAGSKHLSNGAIDIWVPEYEGQPWYRSAMQERLCQFWSSQGESHNFGLGLYATGAIHLDTQGYRIWGTNYTDSGSYCQYLK